MRQLHLPNWLPTSILPVLLLILAVNAHGDFVASPTGTTEWRFDSATGTTLNAAYGPGTMTQQNLPGGTLDGLYMGGTSLGGEVIPDIGGSPTSFLYTSAAAGHFGTNTGYQVFSGVDGPNSGHRQFTMIYDMYIPSNTTQSGYLSLYQGNATNANDVDGYLRLTDRNAWYGGPANQYDFGEWQRLALSIDVDAGVANLYVDGVLESTGAPLDYVYDDGNGLPFWIFSDNNGDHKPTAWANYAFVPDVALDGTTIASLGGANAGGIFNVQDATVPEPASWIVWSGLAAVMLLRRRRSRKS